MRESLITIMFAMVCAAAFLLAFIPIAMQEPRVNCSIAEFSPDIPPNIKSKCREERTKR